MQLPKAMTFSPRQFQLEGNGFKKTIKKNFEEISNKLE